jgi:hypothetical protein
MDELQADGKTVLSFGFRISGSGLKSLLLISLKKRPTENSEPETPEPETPNPKTLTFVL